jgi:hypothetical protein
MPWREYVHEVYGASSFVFLTRVLSPNRRCFSNNMGSGFRICEEEAMFRYRILKMHHLTPTVGFSSTARIYILQFKGESTEINAYLRTVRQ